MLYLIGIGLWDEQNLTIKAIKILKKCNKIYMETYTNRWQGNLDKLKKKINKEIIILNREKVESEYLVKKAKNKNTALLIPGDPLSATTHIQLIKDCKENNVNFKVIHNASILTAIGECGLSLYKFGRVTTLVRPQKNYKPTSPYNIIKNNKEMGLHTLILLDVGGKPLTPKEGAKLLKEMDEDNIINNVISGAKLGSDNPVVVFDLIKNIKLNKYPGFIIVPGNIDENEEEALNILIKENQE